MPRQHWEKQHAYISLVQGRLYILLGVKREFIAIDGQSSFDNFSGLYSSSGFCPPRGSSQLPLLRYLLPLASK